MIEKLIKIPDDFVYEFHDDGILQWLDFKLASDQDKLNHKVKYDPDFIPFKMMRRGSLLNCYKDLGSNGFYVIDEGKIVANGIIDMKVHWPRWSVPLVEKESYEALLKSYGYK